jgi:hypothetical protein
MHTPGAKSGPERAPPEPPAPRHIGSMTSSEREVRDGVRIPQRCPQGHRSQTSPTSLRATVMVLTDLRPGLRASPNSGFTPAPAPPRQIRTLSPDRAGQNPGGPPPSRGPAWARVIAASRGGLLALSTPRPTPVDSEPENPRRRGFGKPRSRRVRLRGTVVVPRGPGSARPFAFCISSRHRADGG